MKSNKCKKIAALAMAAAVTATTGVLAAAAPSPDYDIYAQDGVLQLIQGNKISSYTLREAEIGLYTDKDREMIVSFYEEDGTRRLITLGRQNDVAIDGELAAVNFGKSLSGTTNVVIAPDAAIDTVSINAAAKFRLEGAIGRVLVDDNAKVTVADGAKIIDIVVSADRAHVIASAGASITDVYASNAALVSGVHYSSLKDFTRSARQKKKSSVTIGGSDTTIGDSNR